MKERSRTWCASVMLLASSCVVAADGTPPTVQMDWWASGDATTPISFDPADVGETLFEDDCVIYTGSLLGSTWQLGWTTQVRHEADGAWIDGALSIMNLSNTQQEFSLDTGLQLLHPIAAGALIDLSATVSVTNFQFDGSGDLAALPDGSLISARIDGVTTAGLFDAPYLLQANGPFATATDSGGLTFESVHSANAMIGMLTSFSLSGGDLVNISYTLDIISIPAPGSLALLAMAAICGRRRRPREVSS